MRMCIFQNIILYYNNIIQFTFCSNKKKLKLINKRNTNIQYIRKSYNIYVYSIGVVVRIYNTTNFYIQLIIAIQMLIIFNYFYLTENFYNFIHKKSQSPIKFYFYIILLQRKVFIYIQQIQYSKIRTASWVYTQYNEKIFFLFHNNTNNNQSILNIYIQFYIVLYVAYI